MDKNFFVKSNGLGNEYIVLDEENITFNLSPRAIQTICNVHFGIGSDGILLKTVSDKADFGLRIFNPDGSEAEKSGNGLRIFCKFLYDYGFTKGSKEFTVETKGGVVNAKIEEAKNGRARVVTIDMGRATFKASEIPVNVNQEEVIDYPLDVEDKKFLINCVSVGNPHCVILVDELDEETVRKYGKLIENHPIFPNRINVQFVKPVNKNKAEIRIWERGAGYTLASGSSSSAVASVLYKKGLTDNDVEIVMPGGILKISLDEEFNIKMTGEVQENCKGYLSEELIESFSEE